MKKRVDYTPNSQIKHALRQVWLRSRERQAAIKRDGYSCQKCGAKQSKAKGREVAVEVHHLRGCNWDGVIEAIRAAMLPTPDKLTTLCHDCHKEEGKP